MSQKLTFGNIEIEKRVFHYSQHSINISKRRC